MIKQVREVVPTRVIAIYPNRLGYGYVVMESPLKLLHWNMVKSEPANNDEIMAQINQILKTYGPATVVIEDPESKISRKTPRIKALLSRIHASANDQGMATYHYSREEIRKVFTRFEVAKTKYEIAEMIARNIPALEPMLYDKPKYPYYEKYAVALFDSASLAITHFYNSDCWIEEFPRIKKPA